MFGRVSPLCLLGIPAYGIGVYARWVYILQVHHPRNHVYSDGEPITALAELLTNPSGHQEFFHTIWPPGASAFLALNLTFDPSLGSAAVWQFVLSALSPLPIAHAAHLAYGRRAAWVALAMSALHFGFIHYGGFFLSEALFQFAVAVAVWATVVVLAATGPPPATGNVAATRPASAGTLLGAGVVCGLSWGLAFSFRSNALPVALFAASWLCVRWARRKNRRAFVGLAGGLIGMLLVVAPLSQRCTQLVGQFCPGASNGAMNVALGHAPDVGGLHFVPLPGERRDVGNWWFPPALGQHGYRGTAEVSGSVYDTSRVLTWVKDRFVRDPVEFAAKSLGNALDLFGSTLWPEDFEPLARRRATILEQVVLVFVLIPGMAMWGLNIRKMVKRRDIGCTEAFLTSAVLGVFLVAAASLGEARYRIPFDALFILMATRALAGKDDAPGASSSRAWLRYSVGAAGASLAVAAALLVATVHTRLRLAARLSEVLPAPSVSPALGGTLAASQFGVRRADGTVWDAPGNFRFRCNPACPELRVDLEGERRSRSIEVSADHNDRYEVVFYRRGKDVGRIALGIVDGLDGLKNTQHDVPPSAQTAGYDTLGVRPLYGDGKYSIGHVRLIE
jgi:hypothetical protein